VNYIWIESSSKRKRVGLSKEGFYLSAKTVCGHFNVTVEDIWGVCLPKTHVGGLSIYARSEVSGCKIKELEGRWDPKLAWDFLKMVSIVSLVPTQVFDLVKLGLPAPHNLRLVIVGGGVLRDAKKALELGYKIVETYGMTELSSMAGVKQGDRYMLLPHLQIKEENRALCFKGESVAKIIEINGQRVNVPDWYESDDLGEVFPDGSFLVKGRRGREVKILGELVSLEDVEQKLSEFLDGKFGVVSIPDPRAENSLCLVSEQEVNLDILNSKIPGLYRLSKNVVLKNLPLTDSGKIDYSELKNL
jgi:O-succinylbenzoic acid--CoA ligase